MRILRILPNPFGWRQPKTIGGGCIRNIEVSKRWNAWGTQIESIEPNPSPSLRRNADYVVHEIALPFHEGNLMTDIVNLVIWTLMMFRMFLRWKACRKQFDVVVSGSNISCALHGLIASKLFGIPLVIGLAEVSDYTSSLLSAYRGWRNYGWPPHSAFLKSIGDWLSSRPIESASVFICVSEPIAIVLQRSGILKKQVFVTGNGVDIDTISAIKLQSEKKYEGVFLGRVEKEKGIPELLKSWKSVLKEVPDAKLLVIGSGSFLTGAKNLAKRYEIDKNVEFAGFVPEKLKYSLLKQSKVFIFPTKAREGWGLVVAEAMACGLPVVCCHNPVLVSVFGDSESFISIPVGDITSLANTISTLLKNENLLAKYSELSKAYVKRYSWDAIAECEHKIIENVVRGT